MTNKLLTILMAAFLAGCAAPKKPNDFAAFQAAAPRSILIVPLVNKSLDVDAPNYMLSSMPIPLAERGYYVFPVNTAKMVLEQEGFYESDQVHSQPPEVLAKLFGADAVLYVTIQRWDAQYALLSTVVTVSFDYRMVAKDGTPIWAAKQQLQYSPSQNSSGNPLADLIVAAISAAVTRAAPSYMPLAQQANTHVLLAGPDAPPPGPYLKATAR